MLNFFSPRVTGILLVLFTLLLGSFAAYAQDEVSILVGEQKTIDVRNVRRVAIGDPTIADVKIISDGREMLITGVSSGLTTLTIWDTSGNKSTIQIRVLIRDPKSIARELNMLLGDIEGVEIEVVGEKIVLDGEVFREKDYNRAKMVAEMYPKQVALLIEYNKAYIEMKRMIQIEFKFYEIEKGHMLKMGINWNRLINPLENLVDIKYDLPIDQKEQYTDENGNPQERDKDPSGQITVGVSFNPLKLNDDTTRNRLLLEHQAIVRSGEKVSFIAGGEFPIVYEGGVGGSGGVEWKEYGTKIISTPEIDKINNIYLPIEVEASLLDWANAVQGYPALNVKRSETSVNLKAGQTVLIGGVFMKDYSKNLDGLPGFSRIPLIGYFFGTKEFGNGRTDGVLFVTPTIIEATAGATENVHISAVIDRFELGDLKL